MTWTEERLTAAAAWFFSPQRKLSDRAELDQLVELVQALELAVLNGDVDEAAAVKAQGFLDQAQAFVNGHPEVDARYHAATQRWTEVRLAAALPALASALKSPEGPEQDEALTALLRFERSVASGQLADEKAKALADRFLKECAAWLGARPDAAKRHQQLARRLTLAQVNTAVQYLRAAFKEAGSDGGNLTQWVRDFVLFERVVDLQDIEPGAPTALASDFVHYAKTWWLVKPAVHERYDAESHRKKK